MKYFNFPYDSLLSGVCEFVAERSSQSPAGATAVSDSSATGGAQDVHNSLLQLPTSHSQRWQICHGHQGVAVQIDSGAPASRYLARSLVPVEPRIALSGRCDELGETLHPSASAPESLGTVFLAIQRSVSRSHGRHPRGYPAAHQGPGQVLRTGDTRDSCPPPLLSIHDISIRD